MDLMGGAMKSPGYVALNPNPLPICAQAAA
jgi:hypothetical protein